MYGTPFDTFPRRRRGLRWWQLPLLPITFPLSLLVLFAGWLRRIGFFKSTLVFMVVWVVYGQFVMLVDPGSTALRSDWWMRNYYLNALEHRPKNSVKKDLWDPRSRCNFRAPFR